MKRFSNDDSYTNLAYQSAAGAEGADDNVRRREGARGQTPAPAAAGADER